MILRRIAQGIKEQDWFVVSVEVAIVVVGIFIGLQVDDWNEARRDDARAELAISRLQTDFKMLSGSLEDATGVYVKNFEAATRVMDFIASGEPLSDSYTDLMFRTDLRLLITGTSPRQRSATYVELVSGGNMRLIRDETLRNYLALFDEEVIRTQTVYEIFSDMQMRFTEHMLHVVVYDVEPLERPPGETGPVPVISYDLETMRSDPAVLGAVSMIRSSFKYHINWQKRLVNGADLVLKKINENLQS